MLNDPDFIRNIGDRGVRTLAESERYIESGPLEMWKRHGYALCRVELRSDGSPVGLCGLLKRDALDAPDVGFAFLPDYRGHGYAREAASEVVRCGFQEHGMRRILAIVSKHNDDSRRLLERLGFQREGVVTLPGEDEELDLYALSATDGSN